MIICVSLSIIAVAVWFVQLIANESPSYADIIVTFILFGVFVSQADLILKSRWIQIKI